MTKVVFDVDGTLITFEDRPRYDVINLMKTFSELGYLIEVHSDVGS